MSDNTLILVDSYPLLPDKINNLSIENLKSLINASAKVLKKREESEKSESLEQIVNIVKRDKIPLKELLEMLNQTHAVYSEESINTQASKLYVDPDNSANTWGGVGRHPQWINKKKLEGVDIESLCVHVVEKKEQFFFYNPENKSERWIGVGRKPKWFKCLEEKNIDVNQYRSVI